MVRSRLPAAMATTGVAVAVVLLVVLSHVFAEPLWATSWVVLLAALSAAVVLVARYLRIDPGWVLWRRSILAVAMWSLAYPAWGASAVLADEAAPESRAAWGLAVLAGVGHLPLIAVFSLVPLLALHYLEGGAPRVPIALVIGLLAAAVATFALFFDDFAPLTSQALVDWRPGELLGMGVNLLFLATVLVGPAAPLLTAWRADKAEAGTHRRLALVAMSALGGVALVMVCGALGGTGDLGAAGLLVSMYAAVTLVVLGCTRALTSAPPVDSGPTESGVAGLTPRESEVLALLADGLSNAGIAARLVVSERTVDAHLRSVFTKLDLPESRLDNRRVHAVIAWRDASRSTEIAS